MRIGLKRRRPDSRPEWMRRKPPFPDLKDARACAEYSLSPMVTDEESALLRREQMAIRQDISQLRCQYCGDTFPFPLKASDDHPLYWDELDRIIEEHKNDHDCQWATEARQTEESK